MSVFDKLRRDAGRPVTDPSDHRLFSGTIDDQRQARREYARHSRIRRIAKSGRDEIPRAELTPIRHGMLEHEATGNWYRPFGGDPDFGTADHISAYTMTETGDALCSRTPAAATSSRRSWPPRRPAGPPRPVEQRSTTHPDEWQLAAAIVQRRVAAQGSRAIRLTRRPVRRRR